MRNIVKISKHDDYYLLFNDENIVLICEMVFMGYMVMCDSGVNKLFAIWRFMGWEEFRFEMIFLFSLCSIFFSIIMYYPCHYLPLSQFDSPVSPEILLDEW